MKMKFDYFDEKLEKSFECLRKDDYYSEDEMMLMKKLPRLESDFVVRWWSLRMKSQGKLYDFHYYCYYLSFHLVVVE